MSVSSSCGLRVTGFALLAAVSCSQRGTRYTQTFLINFNLKQQRQQALILRRHEIEAIQNLLETADKDPRRDP